MSVKKIYGCAANVKFRLGNIFKKTLVLGEKKETKTLQLPGKFSWTLKCRNQNVQWVSHSLFTLFRAVAKVFVFGGRVPGVQGGMLPQKIFKIQGPRLAKMHFLRFQLDKSTSARSLALKFGHFKKLSARFGRDYPPWPPLAAALLFEIKCYVLLVKIPQILTPDKSCLPMPDAQAKIYPWKT